MMWNVGRVIIFHYTLPITHFTLFVGVFECIFNPLGVVRGVFPEKLAKMDCLASLAMT